MHRMIRRSQQGATLVFALLFLAALGLIGVASVRSSVTELRMASNTEDEMNALETAQSAIDFMASNPALLPASGPLDTPVNVPLPTPLSVPPVTAFVTLPPETAQARRIADCVPPPRLASGTSAALFSAFTYRLSADVNKTANGKGQSSLRKGHIVLGPKC